MEGIAAMNESFVQRALTPCTAFFAIVCGIADACPPKNEKCSRLLNEVAQCDPASRKSGEELLELMRSDVETRVALAGNFHNLKKEDRLALLGLLNATEADGFCPPEFDTVTRDVLKNGDPDELYYAFKYIGRCGLGDGDLELRTYIEQHWHRPHGMMPALPIYAYLERFGIGPYEVPIRDVLTQCSSNMQCAGLSVAILRGGEKSKKLVNSALNAIVTLFERNLVRDNPSTAAHIYRSFHKSNICMDNEIIRGAAMELSASEIDDLRSTAEKYLEHCYPKAE